MPKLSRLFVSFRFLITLSVTLCYLLMYLNNPEMAAQATEALVAIMLNKYVFSAYVVLIFSWLFIYGSKQILAEKH